MSIGFAGLGRMGLHMAHNLAAAGFDLVVWNRSSEVAEKFSAENGCTMAVTPCALAECTDIVMTMLADARGSQDVHLGTSSLFYGHAATIYIEMGTMTPAHIAELTRLAPQGTRIIDAPVSGATQAAKDPQLLIMAGCTNHDAAPLLSLFQAWDIRASV